jgi:hypothetical protein
MEKVAVLELDSIPAFSAPKNNLLLFSAGLAPDCAVLKNKMWLLKCFFVISKKRGDD